MKVSPGNAVHRITVGIDEAQQLRAAANLTELNMAIDQDSADSCLCNDVERMEKHSTRGQ